MWERLSYCRRRTKIANPRAERLPEKAFEPTLDRTTVEVGLGGEVGGEVAVVVCSTATFVKDDVQEVWAWCEVEDLLAGLPVTRLTTVVDASVWVLKPTCGTVTVWVDQVIVVQGVSCAEVVAAIGPVGEGAPVTC